MGQPSAFPGADLAPPGLVRMPRLQLQLRRLPLAGYLQALEQVLMALLRLVLAHFQANMGQRLLLAVQHLRLPQILTLRTILPWRNLTQLPSRCFSSLFQTTNLFAKSVSPPVPRVSMIVISPFSNLIVCHLTLSCKVVDSKLGHTGNWTAESCRYLPPGQPKFGSTERRYSFSGQAGRSL